MPSRRTIEAVKARISQEIAQAETVILKMDQDPAILDQTSVGMFKRLAPCTAALVDHDTGYGRQAARSSVSRTAFSS